MLRTTWWSTPKNSAKPLTKRPVLEIAHYLKPYGCGMFALLLCRKDAGPAAMHAIREQWIGGSKMILPVTDRDLKELLRLKKQEDGQKK